jgi:hypothetical protein
VFPATAPRIVVDLGGCSALNECDRSEARRVLIIQVVHARRAGIDISKLECRSGSPYPLVAARSWCSADIMRLSGEEGAQIYTQLRARSASMRAAMLNAELTKANEVGERMSIPMSLLGVIFMAILVAPALLRVMGGNS